MRSNRSFRGNGFAPNAIATCFLAAASAVGISQSPGPPSTTAPAPPQRTWVDPATGHRITRLTDERNSHGLYFNMNAFTPGGKEMIYTSPQGIHALDMATLKSRLLVAGAVYSVVVARKSPVVFFMKKDDQHLFAANADTGEVLRMGELPARASISSLNADETLIAGVYIDGAGLDFSQQTVPASLKASSVKATKMDQFFAERLPMVLYTYDLRTGATQKVVRGTDWLNHVQFSPTDPKLLMYCHEGRWHLVDRIWTVRTDGSQDRLMHARTMTQEIAGHEFWSADGRTIWYDLQMPRAQNFNLAGVDVETGERTWYHMERNEWSIHFNISPDGTLFCGDGGDYAQVAKARDGQWIELYHPVPEDAAGEEVGANFVHAGHLHTDHLVNMAKHNYKLEPNVRFSPDDKTVIFTSNMLGGASYIYAVDIAAPATAQ